MFEDKKVLMLEVAKERPPYTPPESFANRVSALSPGTVQLLTGRFCPPPPHQKQMTRVTVGLCFVPTVYVNVNDCYLEIP